VTEFRVDRLLGTLTAHGVDFVVVGGIAATLLGSARDTFDLDICPATDPKNLESLGKALVDLKARLRGVEDPVPFVPDGKTLGRVQLLTLETNKGPLDILMRPDGCPPYEQLRRRAERKDLGSFSVLVASIDDLLAMKESAGRGKDLVVAEELRAIRRLRKRLRVSE
jgi:predicted nucleotidyltransferase